MDNNIDTDEQLKQNFGCKICFEPFTKGRRCPISLYCGHTFCRRCIKELSRSGTFLCGLCRRVTYSDYRLLGKNVLLIEVLEYINLLAVDDPGEVDNDEEETLLCQGTDDFVPSAFANSAFDDVEVGAFDNENYSLVPQELVPQVLVPRFRQTNNNYRRARRPRNRRNNHDNNNGDFFSGATNFVVGTMYGGSDPLDFNSWGIAGDDEWDQSAQTNASYELVSVAHEQQVLPPPMVENVPSVTNSSASIHTTVAQQSEQAHLPLPMVENVFPKVDNSATIHTTVAEHSEQAHLPSPMTGNVLPEVNSSTSSHTTVAEQPKQSQSLLRIVPPSLLPSAIIASSSTEKSVAQSKMVNVKHVVKLDTALKRVVIRIGGKRRPETS